MNLNLWRHNSARWLCEYRDLMWNVKINKPKGKIKNKNWIKNEWENSNK